MLWLLFMTMIASMFGTIEGTDSKSRSHSTLTGEMLELVPVAERDDADSYFQSSFYRSDFEPPLTGNHRSANSQKRAPSDLISDLDDFFIDRHKRDERWIFDANQELFMDGSGTTSTTTTTTESTTTTTTTVTTTTTTTTITTTTVISARPSTYIWTNWIPLGNCTPDCGLGYREEIRFCIETTTGQSHDGSLCGGGNNRQNVSCTFSPPCEITLVSPEPAPHDPRIRMIRYSLPDSMYFFEQTYRRLWVSNKGYISFGTPFYGRTMTESGFYRIREQAIAAPFWTNLLFAENSSSISIQWFSSTNASGSDAHIYYDIIRSAINSACPVASCSSQFTAARVVRVHWKNLIYERPRLNQSMSVSFTAYLINTYESESRYSQPLLRSYIAFDYSDLANNLHSLRPFIGYRGKRQLIRVLNDPSSYLNAAFLTDTHRASGRRQRSFYVGGRFLSACEVSYLQGIRTNMLQPWENLNDIALNPRFPCPCTFAQAQWDRRFGRLHSETSFEIYQQIVCFGPVVENWISVGWTSKLLRSQTCCYYGRSQSLITSGALAGSVLSDSRPLSRQHPWQRRIPFYDQCCAPSHTTGMPNWDRCRLYYQLHPPSSCTGYRPPAFVGGVGDPHMDTIDGGRYTCHIQGVYVFAQTTYDAQQTANQNAHRNVTDMNLIYPNDLFQIRVRAVLVSPALRYIERTQGYGSIFTNYMIIAAGFNFSIVNNNGKFGFIVNNRESFDSVLANNLDYDYTNADESATNDSRVHTYRLTQTAREVMSRTVPQLTLTLWSGLAIQCEIVGENLECILSLPDKFRTYIEGLAGNFNGDPNDDLINRLTNENVTILSSTSSSSAYSDNSILTACRSWRHIGDTTPDISTPILPRQLVDWFYSGGSRIVVEANPLLNESIVNETCAGHFECVHDYLIRTNAFASKTTASALTTIEDTRVAAADMPPTHNLISAVRVTLPFNQTSRDHPVVLSVASSLGISVTNITVAIYPRNTTQVLSVSGGTVLVPMPNDTESDVAVRLIITYGKNGMLEHYLHIIGCFCVNSDSCNFQEPKQITENYELALCECPPQYEGDFCQLPYNACASESPCTVNWANGTTCIALSPTEQILQNQSHYCVGSCAPGYTSPDNFTCEDVDECEQDPSICGEGTCENIDGSYTCSCTAGYRFNLQTCVDIDECTEPNIDGSFPRRCNISEEMCVNIDGSYRCECSPIFNSTGTCIYNATACSGDTCTDDNGSILCLHGTVNVNNVCTPWCNSACPGFCERHTDAYECNCTKYAGYEYSDEELRCIPCRGRTYGYGCRTFCDCEHGVCNRNASHADDSCTCDTGFQGTNCSQMIDTCANFDACNRATEDCQSDPQNSAAICTCKLGYEKNATSGSCDDIDECQEKESSCNAISSTCVNVIGSYACVCNAGYQSVNGECINIDECKNLSAACGKHPNTYCADIHGAHECRCKDGYSVGGDSNRASENVFNTTNVCMKTNLFSNCENACTAPAICNATEGRCQCKGRVLELVSIVNSSKDTCQCPGHPFVDYRSEVCDAPTSQTWLLLSFAVQPSTRLSSVYSPRLSNLATEISAILAAMNKTCGNPCVNINETGDAARIAHEYFVSLDLSLNATERLQLANKFFEDDVRLNDTSLSKVRIIINTVTKHLETFTRVVQRCKECEYLASGSCISELVDDCKCYSAYEGYFCRLDATAKEPVLRASEARRWIIIVGVISAVAGLLLIIACFLCIFRIVSNVRRSREKTATYAVGREAYYIPRAHVPTMGTVGRDLFSWDGFSLHTSEGRNNEAADSYPSSSNSTYNPTYRLDDTTTAADYSIFDHLEKRAPLPRGFVPRTQMVGMNGTLSSFPRDQLEYPAGTFLDSNDLDETELVTDMLEDMTKDDDQPDVFLEASNPHLTIPTAMLSAGVTTLTSSR